MVYDATVPKLSLLVATVPARASLLSRLLWTLESQLVDGVEVLIHAAPDLPIGTKSNELYAAASGEFVARIDDDDLVAQDYVIMLADVLDLGADFVGFKILHTVNGVYDAEYPHDYTRGQTEPGAVIRGISAQMVLPTEVVRGVSFGNSYHDDFAWAQAVTKVFTPKMPAYIDRALYHYDYWPAHSLPTAPDGLNRPQRSVGAWPYDRRKFRWI